MPLSATLALLLAAAPTPPPAPAAPAPPAREEKVCRKIKATVGRLPPKKECHTAAEWAKLDGRGELQGLGTGMSRIN